jgi:hypothetical protein
MADAKIVGCNWLELPPGTWIQRTARAITSRAQVGSSLHFKCYVGFEPNFFSCFVTCKPIAGKQCCGSGMFIPDPGYEFFPSRIRIFSISDPGSALKNLSILTQKDGF